FAMQLRVFSFHWQSSPRIARRSRFAGNNLVHSEWVRISSGSLPWFEFRPECSPLVVCRVGPERSSRVRLREGSVCPDTGVRPLYGRRSPWGADQIKSENIGEGFLS